LRLLPTVEHLGADAQQLRRGLQLSLAKRNASDLNAASYLRRLSGDVPDTFVAMIEEIYVLLLSVFPKLPHQFR
jgi:hypothetical protein